MNLHLNNQFSKIKNSLLDFIFH